MRDLITDALEAAMLVACLGLLALVLAPPAAFAADLASVPLPLGRIALQSAVFFLAACAWSGALIGINALFTRGRRS